MRMKKLVFRRETLLLDNPFFTGKLQRPSSKK